MRRAILLTGLCFGLVAGCDDAGTTPADASMVTDIGNDLGASGDASDAGALPPWPHELPAANVMGAVRGLTQLRAIVHAHSVHSHDACDGNPYVDGGPNEPCLQSFRRAVCRTRLDVVFLTEHADRLATVPLATVLQQRPGDEPVTEGGSLVGYWIRCENGHRTLILPGAENELMPLALTRHPDAVDGSLNRAYHGDDAAGARRFREAGALVAVAHVEQRSIEHLRELQPDIIEVYNVHANLDPRYAALASPEFNIGVGLADTLRFMGRSSPLEPDLAFLAFFAESSNDLGKWAQLWTDGRNVPGIAASDAHENTFATILRDGERGDSYRRIFRFFSNELLVRGAVTRASVVEALREGRAYVAFEAFGTPSGFSFHARTSGSADHEMGATVSLADAPVFVLRAPTLHAPLPGAPAPRVTLKMFRADGGRWVMLQQWDNPAAMGEIRFTPSVAGVYRAEVRIVPEHARAYLPDNDPDVTDRLVRDFPWIYGNPIRVR